MAGPAFNIFTILNIALALLMPIAVIFALATLIIWLRRWRAVRAAGVSPATPGCARCLYLVRGWNGPNCPECGSDVRAAGVCIGARVHLALKLLTALTLGAALAMAAGMPLAIWAFASRQQMVAWRYSVSQYDVDLRAYRSWQRWPARDQRTIEMIVDSDGSFDTFTIGMQHGGFLPVQPAPGRDAGGWRRIRATDADPAITAGQIAQELAAAANAPVSPMMQQQAQALAAVMQALQTSRTFTANFAPPPNLLATIASGSGSGAGVSPAGNRLLVAFIIALPLTAMLLVWLRHRRGWRPAIDGEWIGPAAGDLPTTQERR